MTTKEELLREKLAAIEHEKWADWQKWVHKVFREQFSPEIMEVVEPVLGRWEKQIVTPYAELSDEEKASDMEQVDRYWPLILDWHQKSIDRAVVEARIEEVIAFKNVKWPSLATSDDFQLSFDNRLKELKKELEVTKESESNESN